MSSQKTISVLFTFSSGPDATSTEELDFPTTKETLNNMLSQAKAAGKTCISMSPTFWGGEGTSPIGELTDFKFNEENANALNYLAAKLSELDGDDLEKFEAVIESGRHIGVNGIGNGELTDYINIADNLDSFTFHPGMDEEQYGEHLLSERGNLVDQLIHQLHNSASQRDQEFAQYVECLRECADVEQFGRSMANNNDGEFLESGYLIEDSGFNDAVYGIEDIPAEYRIWDPPDLFIKVADVDLRGLLMEMHALGGNYTQDAASNLQTLMSGDCFIAVKAERLAVLPAAEVFRMDSPHYNDFINACSGHARVFFAAVSEDDGSAGYRGNIHEVVTDAIMQDVYNLKLSAVIIDVEFKDGTNGKFLPFEWSELPESDKNRVAGLVHRYDSFNEKLVDTFLSDLRNLSKDGGRVITQEDFLTVLNAPFMARAQNAQPDMLRVARETARDMVARGDAEVYRLLPEGALKLSPMDVVKTGGLWFKEHREFAIKLGGMAGLRKWANRTADDIARQATRGEQRKSRDNGIE